MTVLSGWTVNVITLTLLIRPMTLCITPAAYPMLPFCARPPVVIREDFFSPAAIVFLQFVNHMSDVFPEPVIRGTNVIPAARREGSL